MSSGHRYVAMAHGLFAALATGCATPDLRDRDWNALHSSTPPSPVVEHALEQGFQSCRNLLQDAVLHAVGDSPHEAWGGGASAQPDRRPVSYALVTGAGANTEHAVVTAGLDGSGKCFAHWRVTRVWPLPCAKLERNAEWLRLYAKERDLDPTTAIYRSEGSGISVVLTGIGRHRCMASLGEIAYWDGDGVDLDSTLHASPGEAPP